MSYVSQAEIHALAVEKGWWPQTLPEGRIPEALVLIHSEISEALEEYRKGVHPSEVLYGEKGKPEGFAIELADVLIRLRDLCEALDIDLEEMVSIKHKFNKTRGFRHGGKKA